VEKKLQILNGEAMKKEEEKKFSMVNSQLPIEN
jgi:hypothetical protein